MGRGKTWTREECEAVAKAWKHTSELIVSTWDQSSKRFVYELYKRFIDLAPSDPDALEGRWTSRSRTAVKTQFDVIAGDILKFNDELSAVMEQTGSHSIELGDPRVVRAALAVHLDFTSTISFNNLEIVETDWKLYEAWLVLKTCPRYQLVNWSRFDPAQQNTNPSPSDTLHPSRIESDNNSYIGDDAPATEGTPMKTLASAALSMPIAQNTLSISGPPNNSSVGTCPAQDSDVKGHRPFVDSHDNCLGKRRLVGDTKGQALPKNPRTEPGMWGTDCRAIELVAQAVCALGDALSEYNALALFSRPDMEGQQGKKMYLEALAEKYTLKARLDRDKLVNEMKRTNRQGSQTISK